MIGIQVVSHGEMAEGMIDSLSMIFGDTENVIFNELERGADVDQFRAEVLKSTESIMSEDGVLILTDIFGASPYNSAMINSRDVDSDKYKVICGVNLPLLIEAVSNRSFMNIDELYKHLLDSAPSYISGWEK